MGSRRSSLGARPAARIAMFLALFGCGLLAAALFLGSAGAAQKPDSDGDYYPDDVDTCPTVFNPDNQRGSLHWDWDGDGIANACDPTPGVPATEVDAHIYLHAKDGSMIASPVSRIEVQFHFVDGSSHAPAYCTTCWSESIYRDESGNVVKATSADVTIFGLPAGCANAQPGLTFSFALVRGAWTHYDVTFDGDNCGIGFRWGPPDPTTGAGSTTLATTMATTGTTPAAPTTTVVTDSTSTPTTTAAPPVLCHVPTLIGRTLVAARSALESANCSLGPVKSVYSVKRNGTVVGQAPAGGATRPADAPVALTVSRGPKPH